MKDSKDNQIGKSFVGYAFLGLVVILLGIGFTSNFNANGAYVEEVEEQAPIEEPPEKYREIEYPLKTCDCSDFEISMSNAEFWNRYSYYLGISGSMRPLIKPGDHFYADDFFPFEGIKVGDIIAFSLSGEKYGITHRVVRIETDQTGIKYFVTKGDNNDYEDEERVYKVMYQGKVICLERNDIYCQEGK